jgi:hypothetical protein
MILFLHLSLMRSSQRFDLLRAQGATFWKYRPATRLSLVACCPEKHFP